MKSLMPYVCPAALTVAALLPFPLTVSAADTSTVLPLTITASTVPPNGDLNPYGVAIVPKTVSAGGLHAGDVLVSNFNDVNNLQGRGSTIMRISANGQVSLFSTVGGHAGLTAALGVLSNGVVLVGNMPTVDGTPVTISAGNLSVLDSDGNFEGTIGTVQSVDGPWGMTIYDRGSTGTGTAAVFLSNAISGTVSRFDVSYTPSSVGATVTTIATGFNHRLDPVAIVAGPAGMAYNPANDTLYVVNSDDSTLYSIPTAAATKSAVAATPVMQDFEHLHGPIGVVILPNGHFLISNSDASNVDPNQPSELVEYTSSGEFLAQMPLDPNNGGAFGIATSNLAWGAFRLASVDDNKNSATVVTAVSQ